MALDPLQAAEFNTEGGRGNSLDQPGGGMQVANGTWTAVAAGQGTASILRLPAGLIRVYPQFSYLLTADLSVAGADLHIGYAAYTNSAGVAVSGDDNAFLDNGNLGGAVLSGVWLLPTVATSIYTEFDSQAGIEIEIMIDSADASIGETVQLVCAYSVVG